MLVLVGPEGAELASHTTRAILAHDADGSVLTIGVDVETDAPLSFGVLVPANTATSALEVATGDPFAYLDQYTRPRSEALDCQASEGEGHDLHGSGEHWYYGGYDSYLGFEFSDASAPAPPERYYADAVESIELLAAADVPAWLTTQGFAAPADPDGVLAGYSHFVAVRFDLAHVRPNEPASMRPFTIALDGDVASLPLVVATLGGDDQDLVLYVLGDLGAGQATVAGLPAFALESGCLWSGEPSLDAFYDAEVDRLVGSGPGWWIEYGIDVGDVAPCSPCTTSWPLWGYDLGQWGWPGTGARLDRLHLRYGPGDVDGEVALVPDGTHDLRQLLFFTGPDGLESTLPVCGVGMVPDPPTCAAPTDSGACGHARGSALAGALALGLVRRRQWA
jgi:hypothetical protein